MSSQLARDRARDHVDFWYERKKLLLDEERAAVNTACITFMALLDEPEQPNFSLPEALLNAAFQAALAAVPGGLAVTKSWQTAMTTAKIMTDEGKELAKLALEGVVSVGRDLGQRIDKSMETDRLSISTTRSMFLDNYLKQVLAPIHRARIETNVVWEEWRNAVTSWQPDKGDVSAVVRRSLPLPDMSAIQHRLDMFRVAADYYLTGAYVRANVVVIKVYQQVGSSYNPVGTQARHPTRGRHLRTEVQGLNNTQLEIIYTKFGTASAVPRQASSEAAAMLQRGHRVMRRMVGGTNTQFIDRLRTNRQWSGMFHQTALKDINSPSDLVTVWGARESWSFPR